MFIENSTSTYQNSVVCIDSTGEIIYDTDLSKSWSLNWENATLTTSVAAPINVHFQQYNMYYQSKWKQIDDNHGVSILDPKATRVAKLITHPPEFYTCRI
jgi:hypothetical protein